jgi:hypothetical protein
MFFIHDPYDPPSPFLRVFAVSGMVLGFQESLSRAARCFSRFSMGVFAVTLTTSNPSFL